MTKLNRFPKVLWQEVQTALARLRHLPSDDVTELLARYRAHRAAEIKYIAEHGIMIDSHSPSAVTTPEPVPWELRDAIKRLDEAFRKLHHYNHGGQEDYVSEGVRSAVNRIAAGLPRNVDGQRELRDIIFDALVRARYSESDNKEAIKLSLMSNLDVKRYQIDKVVTIYNLAIKEKT